MTKKTNIVLILLTIVGFLMRLKAALNIEVFADDMLYASQSAGIINAGILSTHSNPPLFFYLTDLAYKVFGYSTFASRFWPLIAGTLLIPLIFFITKKLSKDENVSLAAAFFVAFCTFLIRMDFTEQTLVVLFFVAFSYFCGLCYMDKGNKIWLYAFGLGFGLASLTKYSAPFFFISFGIFALHAYEKKLNHFHKPKFKNLLIVAAIILFFSLPFLAFNYLIYKESGIVDVYFSRIIHLDSTQQLYGGLAGQGDSFFTRLTNLNSYGQYKLPFITDPILTLFALFGFYLLFKKKDKLILPFVLISLIVPFVLQSGGSALAKHFAFMHLFLVIPAGFALVNLKDKIKSKEARIGLYVVLIVGMLLSLGTTYGTPENFREKSATSQLKSYINDKVGAEDLLILDTRTYTARNFWLATPNSFILSSQFPSIYEQSINISSNRLRPINVFFVECAIDDCGWGWVKDDQNLNKSTEELVSVFSQSGLLVKSISAPKSTTQEYFKKGEENEVYRIYQVTLNLPPEILEQSKKFQSFYFTPYLYANMDGYLFNYNATGIGNLLDKFSLLIIYLAILSALLVIGYVLWFSYKNLKNRL